MVIYFYIVVAGAPPLREIPSHEMTCSDGSISSGVKATGWAKLVERAWACWSLVMGWKRPAEAILLEGALLRPSAAGQSRQPRNAAETWGKNRRLHEVREVQTTTTARLRGSDSTPGQAAGCLRLASRSTTGTTTQPMG
jgi:hypothetical protein